MVYISRYIAIVHPLHYSRYMTKLVTRLMMSFTWSVAVCISCIPVFWNDWHEGVACEMNLVRSTRMALYYTSYLYEIRRSSKIRAPVINPNILICVIIYNERCMLTAYLFL